MTHAKHAECSSSPKPMCAPFADYERSLPTTVRLGSWFTSADTEAAGWWECV
ncbi:MAG: hypothetical protein R3C56_13555 [Pirellulaceae bacterium]